MSEKKQTIYLMRHAKPSLPYDGRVCYGATDYPLSQEGILHAKSMALNLSNIHFTNAFSSTMQRAKDTAEIILSGRDIAVKEIEALSEINLGDWEGKPMDSLEDERNLLFNKTGWHFTRMAPPNGESLAAVEKRAVPAFIEALDSSSSGNILIVAHGAVIWTIMSNLFDFRLKNMFLYPLDFCGIHVIERVGTFFCLRRYNWGPDLV